MSSASRRRGGILDLGGLVSPEVVSIARESRGSAATFRAVLVQMRPDFLVLRSIEVDLNVSFHGGPLFETLAQRLEFSSSYREIARFSAPDPSFLGPLSHLTVYERRADGASSATDEGAREARYGISGVADELVTRRREKRRGA